MFHLGKIIELFGNDDWDYKKIGSAVTDADKGTIFGSNALVQATVEMWDDNVMTFTIDDEIVDDVEIGDIVLVDYTLMPTGNKQDGMPVPRNLIVKVMKGGVGENAWSKYRDFFKKRTQTADPQSQPRMFR